MGLLDKVRKALHGKSDEVAKGIDKVADVVDGKIDDKHDKTIDSVADKAKDVVDDLDQAPSKPAGEPG